MLALFVLFFGSVLFINVMATTKNFNNYKVAVLEYYPVPYDATVPPDRRFKENINMYRKYVGTVKQDLDIVVFPESVLTVGVPLSSPADLIPYSTEVPDPLANVVLCGRRNKYSLVLNDLSCIAKDAHTYAVVNLVERVQCFSSEKCSPAGYNFYNANVVFDRRGKVIARYRKYNLYGERFMNKTETAEMSTFVTDFGVKFGTFICFDLLFRKPTVDLITKQGIQNFVFPLMWFSQLPFLTSLQVQQQFAHEYDIVLIAAGANNPNLGSSGSGIYKGKQGPIVAHINEKAETNVYSANLSSINDNFVSSNSEKEIDEKAKQMDTFFLKKENLSSYVSELLDFNQATTFRTICHQSKYNSLCCHFYISSLFYPHIYSNKKNHYQYHLVVYAGLRPFAGVSNDAGVEVCAIVACKNKTLASCGQRFEDYSTVSWPLLFQEISISANFTLEENRIQLPNTLLSNIQPIAVEYISWSRIEFPDEKLVQRIIKLLKYQNRLMTFGIYGRNFNPNPEIVI